MASLGPKRVFVVQDLYWRTSGPIDRTVGIPGYDKKFQWNFPNCHTLWFSDLQTWPWNGKCHKISVIQRVFLTMTLLKTLWSNVLPNPHVFQPLILFLKRTKLNFQTFRHGGGCLGDQSNPGEPWTFCKETSTHWKASGETSLQIPTWRLLCHHQGYWHSLRYLRKKKNHQTVSFCLVDFQF